MLHITFEAHATTVDNEQKQASGWSDAKLSDLGIQQAEDLGRRRKLDDYAAVFTSDLERAYQTATIAFGKDTLKIFQDWRLRECNYGDLTGHSSEEVEAERSKRITAPFPNGESYEQTAERMWNFLGDLKKRYDGEAVLLIGHRATQYALEHWINDTPLEETVSQKFVWQPGWDYELK
ncbi:MAG TPA: histidine phosphatase family protein [Candidatus Saccharimonadales bacterium]|nr:histidine phosphatase family protein [Candidatus Saccharimonadales bacterium]